MPTSDIAKIVGVSPRWIRSICARYRGVDLGNVVYPMCMGRPMKLPGRREYSAVITHRIMTHLGATELGGDIEDSTGIHIPHNTHNPEGGRYGRH